MLLGFFSSHPSRMLPHSFPSCTSRGIPYVRAGPHDPFSLRRGRFLWIGHLVMPPITLCTAWPITSAREKTVLATPTTARRVLVVDYDRGAADRFVLELRRLGHYVRVSYEAKDALDAARRLRADVVFLALVMPGMDGYEVAQQLRQDTQLRHVLIVGLNGFAKAEHRRRSRGARIDHHLTKPVDLEFVSGLLGKRR
jgi:CheY-like chemotaxis protein